MLDFFIYFIDFIRKRKCYKTQNNRKFKPKIGEMKDFMLHGVSFLFFNFNFKNYKLFQKS